MIWVLAVDDNPEILSLAKQFLEINPDFVVDTTESPLDGLTLLKKNPYQAIISDYSMPEMDGITFLKKVRSNHPTIPFIFFTGKGSESTVIEALNNGADFYIKKSYEPKTQFFELAQIIRLSLSRLNSEELLRKSEEKFRTIADYSHEWMYWIDPEGKMQYVSPSCKQITGYTPEEFYLNPDLINQIVFREDQDLWLKHLYESPFDSDIISLDIRIVQKNGKIRWIRHLCQSIITGGRYEGRRITNQDVTSQKNTEAMLLHERDNFLKIFRAAPVGLLLLDTNTEITQANEAISTIVLREPSEIIRNRGGGGLGCIHSTEDHRGCGFSSSCPDCPLRKGIEAAIRDKVRIHGVIISLTLLEENIPRLRWLKISTEPVDIDGADYVIVAVDDVTEQHEIETALEESEKKFRALSDSTAAGILMYQGDHWTYANPAAALISGYSEEELLSMKWEDLLQIENLKQMNGMQLSPESVDDVFSQHNEVRIIQKSGNERWVDLVIRVIPLGAKTASLVTAIDITDRKIAEEKLRISEEKYRSIFENHIDLIFQTDLDGKIRDLSPSCRILTGYEVSDLIGRSARDLYQVPNERKDLILLLLSQGAVYDYETRMVNKGGDQIWVSINCHIIRDKDNLPILIEGTIRDISERKKIEDDLRKSEEHYRSLFDNMLEGFAYCRMLYDSDNNPTDWIYLEANAAFDRITGLCDVVGKQVTQVIPNIHKQTPELFDIYNRVVVSGIPETFEINFTPLNTWMKVSVYRPEKGHFVAVFENISQQKIAEADLQNIIAEHQTILQNVRAMIWYKDINDTFIKVNPAAARVFGKPVEAIEGKTFSELFPGVPDRFSVDDRDVVRTKTPKIGIVEKIRDEKGHPIWVQTDIIPLTAPQGVVTGVLVVSTDITERKMAKDALALTNKKLHLLSSITRHDIANQLQGLFFALDLAHEDYPDPAAKNYIIKAGTFAHNIERQIAFTRDYQDIGVNSPIWATVKDVIALSAKSLALGSIEIRIILDEVKIYADPLLERVFHNLIDNSIRYGKTITEIRFSGHEADGGYVILCEDDGEGVPEEFKLKIFNREYFQHTGFGLNLSREILGITGITISETGTPGKGARFEIHVPKGMWRNSS